jgi:two-component system, LuxR family, response regulator FixJ
MIFLVEDDNDTRDAISLLLECEALRVQAFASCDALRQTADLKMADCLILDVHMNGMTGLELLELMQKEGDNPPVIMMTGRPTASVCDRAAAAGAFALLEKPFSGKQLVETVLRAIATKSAPAGSA